MGLYALAPATRRAVAAMTARPPRPASIARWAIIILVGGYLLLPLVAMAEFSTRGDFGGARRSTPDAAIVEDPNLIDAIVADRRRSPR